jgi:hypothetical protein
MRKLKFSLLILFFTFWNILCAQITSFEDKVKFSYSIEQTECEAFLVVKVSVIPGWHVNAFNYGNPGGRSEIIVKSNQNYAIIGKTSEPNPIFEKVDPDDEPSAYHIGTITFKQKFIVISKNDFNFPLNLF